MEDKQDTSAVVSVNEPGDHDERLEAASRLPHSAQAIIRDELDRLLASPRFSSSHRCQALLSHVVNNTLLGKEELLKERSIGSAVFGRAVNYDTNSDAVVRIAASEIRKKLAQYYFDPASQSKVRIGLPSGSYVPVFFWSDSPARSSEETRLATSEPADPSVVKQREALNLSPAKTSRSRKAVRWVIACCALFAGAVGLFRILRPIPTAGFDLFWAPVEDSRNPALVCVGHRMLTWHEYDADASQSGAVSNAAQSSDRKNRSVILLSDAITMSSITALLREKNKPFSVRGQAFTTFGDLQKGPVVLIGAFNNQWATKLMEPMRFHFARDPDSFREWIADAEKPDARIGLVQMDTGDFTKADYALVVRVLDPQTKEATIIVAGVTSTATHAAGEFITNPVYLNDFAQKAPRNWQTRNMELLVVTQNVNGESGPPRVVTSYFW